MPTPQDLQRLRGLLTQLNAIGNVQRGELIRAEDWNTLVNAVTDVAQAVLAEEAAETVPAHEHLDQVSSAWLSPQLREVFERGPLADPAAQQRLLELEQKLKRLADRIDESRSNVEDFRKRLTDVATRDLEREAAVTNVRRAVENVLDARPDLLNIRNTLASVQREMGTVLQAASRLTVNGQPVDLGSVVNRVDELEGFRNRLRGANGELLDGAAIERRIGEVANRTVSQQQLDDAIRTRPTQVPTEVLSGIEDRLGTNLRNQVSERLGTFGNEIRGDVSNRLSGVGDLVNSRLNDALPGVTQSITTNLNAAIETARRTAIDSAIAGAGQALNTREQAIRADLTAGLADVRSGIAGAVRTEVGQQLPGQLAGIRTDLTAFNRRVDLVSAQATRHDETLNQHSIAIAAIPQDQTNLRNDLRTSLLAEIELRSANTSRLLNDRLNTFDRSQSDNFRALSEDLRKQASDAALRIATETATTQLRDMRAQILAEMRTVAREEVTVGVRDQVKTSVNEAVKEQFATVPQLIATEVRRTSSSSTGGTATRFEPGTLVLGRGIVGGGG
jgi:hypothetical protein